MSPTKITRNADRTCVSVNANATSDEHETRNHARSFHHFGSSCHLGSVAVFASLSAYINLVGFFRTTTRTAIDTSTAGLMFGMSVGTLLVRYATQQTHFNRVPTLTAAELDHSRRHPSTNYVRIFPDRRRSNHFAQPLSITPESVVNRRQLHARVFRAATRTRKCATFH